MAGRARIVVCGEQVQYHDGLTVSESVARGARLHLRLRGARVPQVKAGDAGEVGIRLEDGRAQTAEWKLFCSEVRVDDGGAGRLVTVVAEDPVAFCNHERQFVSRVGTRPLREIADEVIRECFAGSVSSRSDGSGDVRQEWLLQAHESGREFIARVARSNGGIVYWDRDHIRVVAAGQAPSESRLVETDEEVGKTTGFAPTRLAWSAVERSVSVPGRAQQVMWTDPESRDTRRAQIVRDVETKGVVLTDRIPTSAAPSGAEYFGLIGVAPASASFRVRSSRCDVRLGDRVHVDGAETQLVVAEIEHSLQSGQYENWLTLMPPQAWGIAFPGSTVGLYGPVQAEVSHNDDPARRQRIRVILSEDRSRRPSPWIPITTLSAPDRGGLFLVPEVGDLVLLVFDRACPEDMYCIGAIRNARQRVPEQWASEANARKALFFPSGVGVTFDEEKQVLRLQTTGAYIELTGDRVVINANSLEIRTASSTSIQADGEVSVDGTRINLG